MLGSLTRLPRPLAALTAAATAALLTGCTSGTTPDHAVTSAGPSSGSPSALPAAATRTTVDDKGGVGAKADLTDSSCTADSSGAWSLTGTLRNATGQAQRYTVEASVVNPDGWAVRGSVARDVTVPPGETGPVTAKAFYTSPAAEKPTAQCVLRVVRHPA